IVALASGAHAQSFNQFYGFGDSTIDSGWWKAALPANATGNPTKDALIANSIALGGTGAPVGAGYLIHSQVLASYFGLRAVPANQRGGTNYAISGAVNAADVNNGFIGNLNPNPNLPSTQQQILNYLAANGGRANPNGLYLISSGGNDITFANDNFATLAAKENYLTGQVAQLTGALQILQAAGARYIIVTDNHGQGTLADFYNQQ